jgi:hypothetical protein
MKNISTKETNQSGRVTVTNNFNQTKTIQKKRKRNFLPFTISIIRLFTKKKYNRYFIKYNMNIFYH